MGESEKNVCCICGEEYEGHGNNPQPVVMDDDARCCDECNANVVLPARIRKMEEYRDRQSFTQQDVMKAISSLLDILRGYADEPVEQTDKAKRVHAVYQMAMGLNLLQDVLLYGEDMETVWQHLDRFMVALGINDAHARLEEDEDD